MKALPSGREMADIAVQNGAIDMAQGVVHTSPPDVFLEVLQKNFNQRREHVYSSPAGFSEYREALLGRVLKENSALTIDQIMGTNGVTGGLIGALRAHCKPLDHVLLMEPYYPAHHWAIQSLNLVTEFLPYTGSFEVDIDEIQDKLSGVQAFLLANPANPTGTVISPKDLLRLYQACRKHNVLLIMDEVYADFIWEDEYESLLSMTDDLSHLVICRSFSKNLGLAGWRAGYAITTPERRLDMTQVHEAFYVGAPAVTQLVMADLLKNHEDKLTQFTQNVVALYADNRIAIAEAMKKADLEPVLKNGAYYMVAKHNRENDIAAMKELLDKGIAIAPGVPFWRPGTKDTGYIRAHFAISEENCSKVVKLLSSA